MKLLVHSIIYGQIDRCALWIFSSIISQYIYAKLYESVDTFDNKCSKHLWQWLVLKLYEKLPPCVKFSEQKFRLGNVYSRTELIKMHRSNTHRFVIDVYDPSKAWGNFIPCVEYSRWDYKTIAIPSFVIYATDVRIMKNWYEAMTSKTP